MKKELKEQIDSNLFSIADLQHLVDVPHWSQLDSLLKTNHYEYIDNFNDTIFTWRHNSTENMEVIVEQPEITYYSITGLLIYHHLDDSNLSSLKERLESARYVEKESNTYENGKYHVSIDESNHSITIYNIRDLKSRKEHLKKLQESYIETIKQYLPKAHLLEDTLASLLATTITVLDSSEIIETMADSLSLADSFLLAREKYSEIKVLLDSSYFTKTTLLLNKLSSTKRLFQGFEKQNDSIYFPITFSRLASVEITEYSHIKNHIDSINSFVSDNQSEYPIRKDIIVNKYEQNDINDLYSQYYPAMKSKESVRKLYQELNYDKSKIRLEELLKKYKEDREEQYRQNQAYSTFIGMSSDDYFLKYDQTSPEQMADKMREIKDTILLHAIKSAPNLKKQDFKKHRDLEISSRYSQFYTDGKINIDNYKQHITLYQKIQDIILNYNLDMIDEYNKNGNKFPDKYSFFDMYLSENYAVYLKNEKEREQAMQQRMKEIERSKQKAEREQEALAKERERTAIANIRKSERNAHRAWLKKQLTPVEIFMWGFDAGLQISNEDIGIDFGTYLMFPTHRMISWGLYGNINSDIILNTGVQFFLSRSNSCNFLFGAGAGYDFEYENPSLNLRLGLRLNHWTLFTQFYSNPIDEVLGITFNLGFHFGH